MSHKKEIICSGKSLDEERVRKDLTGQRFGKLTVIRFLGRNLRNNKPMWECKCDCGNTTIVSGYALCNKNNGTKSCGCLNRERSTEVNSKPLTNKEIDYIKKHYNKENVCEMSEKIGRSQLLISNKMKELGLEMIGKRKTNEEFLQELKNRNFKFEVLNQYKTNRTKIKLRCPKCNEVFFRRADTLTNRWNTECPKCHYGHDYSKSAHPIEEDQTLWFQNPEIAEMLVNEQEGYDCTPRSNKYKLFQCPYCGKKVTKSVASVVHKGVNFHCHVEGISIPEKMMTALLNELNIEYIPQYRKRNAEWCGRYHYDFYIGKYKMIVQVNGGQHYVDTSYFNNTVEHQQEIDNEKKQLALDNGIQVYIEVNCSKIGDSFEKFIQELEKTDFTKYFNIESLDINKLNYSANYSIMNDVIKQFKNGEMPWDIADSKNKDVNVIYKYLECGKRLGLCEFNKDEIIKNSPQYQSRHTIVSCYDLHGKLKKTFSSATEASEWAGKLVISNIRQRSIDEKNKLLWFYESEPTVELTEAEKKYAKTGVSNRGSAKNKKAVYQCSPDGNPVQRFDGMNEAARALGKKTPQAIKKAAEAIRNCCKGRKKSYLGYHWRYVNPE